MKSLCKLSKDLPKNISFFAKQSESPKIVCSSCGRLAGEKDLVCEPKSVKKILG